MLLHMTYIGMDPPQTFFDVLSVFSLAGGQSSTTRLFHIQVSGPFTNVYPQVCPLTLSRLYSNNSQTISNWMCNFPYELSCPVMLVDRSLVDRLVGRAVIIP